MTSLIYRLAVACCLIIGFADDWMDVVVKHWQFWLLLGGGIIAFFVSVQVFRSGILQHTLSMMTTSRNELVSQCETLNKEKIEWGINKEFLFDELVVLRQVRDKLRDRNEMLTEQRDALRQQIKLLRRGELTIEEIHIAPDDIHTSKIGD